MTRRRVGHETHAGRPAGLGDLHAYAVARLFAGERGHGRRGELARSICSNAPSTITNDMLCERSRLVLGGGHRRQHRHRVTHGPPHRGLAARNLLASPMGTLVLTQAG